MTQSISFELKKTFEGKTYTAVVLEHAIGQHTQIRVETALPGVDGTKSLNEIQAHFWEQAAADIAVLVKGLRQSTPSEAPTSETNSGS